MRLFLSGMIFLCTCCLNQLLHYPNVHYKWEKSLSQNRGQEFFHNTYAISACTTRHWHDTVESATNPRV